MNEFIKVTLVEPDYEDKPKYRKAYIRIDSIITVEESCPLLKVRKDGDWVVQKPNEIIDDSFIYISYCPFYSNKGEDSYYRCEESVEKIMGLITEQKKSKTNMNKDFIVETIIDELKVNGPLNQAILGVT